MEAEQRRSYNEKRLARTQAISSVLAQIFSVKAMGLEFVITKYLHREKAAEITALLQERYSRMTVFALGK